MMLRRRFALLAVSLAIFAGCQSNRFHAGTQTDPIRYAVIGRDSTDEMASVAARAAEAAAGRAATGAGLYYRIERETPTDDSPAAQAAAIDRVAASKPDGMLVALNPGDDVELAIKKASSTIPMILLWQDAPKSGRMVACAPNDMSLGEELARQILDVRKGMSAGKVAVLSTNAKSESLEKRIQGIRRHFKSLASGVEVVTVYGDGDPAISEAKLLEARRKHPDVRGLIVLGDWLFRGATGLAAIPPASKVTTVAADASPDTRKALRMKRIARVVAPRCIEAGASGIVALEQVRKSGKDRFETPFDTGYDILYPDVRSLPVGESRSGIRSFTVEQYDSKWSSWLDKGVDADS